MGYDFPYTIIRLELNLTYMGAHETRKVIVLKYFAHLEFFFFFCQISYMFGTPDNENKLYNVLLIISTYSQL